MNNSLERHEGRSTEPDPLRLLNEVIGLSDPIWSQISWVTGQQTDTENPQRYTERLRHIDKIRALIDQDGLERRPFNQHIEMPSDEQIKNLMGESITRFFSHAQEIGMLSPELIDLLDTFSDSSNITVVSKGTESIKVLGSELFRESFPANPQEGARIYVNPFVLQWYTNFYLDLAEKVGIQVDPMKLRNAVIGAIAVHERAHILEGALRTKFVSLVAGSEGYNSRLAIARSIHLLSRHQEELQNETIATTEPHTRETLNAERLGAGMEIIALDFFLNEYGVSDEVRQNLIAAIHKRDASRREQYKDVLAKLYAKGFDDYAIQVFISDIRMLALSIFDEETVADICLPGGMSFWRSIGYTHAYTPEELRYILQASMEDLTEGKARALLLD